MEVASQTDYDEREAGKLSTADAGKLVDGGNLWNKVDWESNRNKRNETIEGLKRLEKEVPDLSTAKHWQELEREGDPSKVNSKIEKINAGSLTYYMRLLDQSGAFQAGGVFGEFLQEERDGLLKGFNKLDLSKGNPSKIEVIRDIKDTLKPKKEFMEKYKKQTPFVKQLFDDALPTLGLRRSKDGQIIGSKEELLDDIIEEVGKMEDEPPAIQKEFRKRSKGKALKPDQLKKLAKEIQEEWGKLNGKYTGEIFKNMNFFGGRTVETPEDGPMSLTASEFIGEFRELEDLATMKVWLKKLPNYIKDRQKLYAKRDKLLEQATTEDKARFEKITGKMRRHELKAYIADTLEPSIRSNNLMTAEFVGEIVTARGKGNMDLYNSFERAQKKVKFTAATLEQQKAMLTVERMEIGQRREVVDRYMSLPPQYRNDAMFRSSHGVTRDQMLAEAESSYNKAQNADPFEMDDTEISGTLNDGQIRDMSEALKAESGKRMMKHLLGKQSAEESKKSLDVTRDAFRRGKDHILMQEHKDLDQLQAWDKDLCTWTYKDENLKELHQTSKTNKRQRGKIEFHRHARDLWEKGFTTHSGGEVQRRQDITDQDLLKGRKEKISEKHSQSKYFTDLAFFMEDGREMKIGRMLSRVVKQSMDKYIPIMLQDIAANMGLSNSAASGFIKSNKAEANVKEFLLQTGIVDKELEEIPTSA